MGFEDVEIRHLTALASVAEEGSFIGAADVLGYSQAAISQQIAGLERAVGLPLFDRPGGPRPVTLTPAGRLLLEHARAILDRLGAARAALADLESGTAGRLVCGTYQSVSVQLLPELVREMRAIAPNLEISLVEHHDNEELIDLLLNGDIDVTFLEGGAGDSRLDMIELGEDPFVVVVPAGSPAAAAPTFPTADLSSIPLIGEHDSSTQRRIVSGLRANGVKPRYAFRSSDNGAMQGMVRAGLGPAVMPRLAVDFADPGIVVKALDPPIPPRTISIATRKGATPLPAATAFIDLAITSAQHRLVHA